MWNHWEEIDRAFLDKADELWIVPMKEYQESKGINAEAAYARELGIPVVHLWWLDLKLFGE